MKTLIKKTFNFKGHLVYWHQEAGRHYRRVVGGLAWPSPPAPGWLVVLGEEAQRDMGLSARRLWVLAARTGAGLEDLHRGCLELRQQCQSEVWLTQVDHRPEVPRWWLMNRDLPEEARVFLTPTPYAGQPAVVISQLIGDFVLPHRKVLHFGKDSQLAREFLNLQTEDLKRPVDQFPALAALGYAMAEMALRQSQEWQGQQPQVINTWNPYESI